MKNAIKWFEIPATDLQRARRFYEAIFQFEMHPLLVNDNLAMVLFPANHGGVGGALCKNETFYRPGHEGPLVYLNANPDVQAVLDRVESAGGKILKPKTKINGEIGYMALITDSEGNRVALMSDPQKSRE